MKHSRKENTLTLSRLWRLWCLSLGDKASDYSNAADMVAIARAMLNDPRWVWHAADTLGIKIQVSPQYARARPESWPGYYLP